MKRVFQVFIALSTSSAMVESFAPSLVRQGISTTELSASRREVIGSSAATIASAVVWIPSPAQAVFSYPITEQSAANKENESFQGVYWDPNHPTGYRIIQTNGDGKVTMTLCDGGPKDGLPTFRDIPVNVKGEEFTFDFSFKNGPKNIPAKLSADKQSLTFADGNSWIKNYYKYEGIYKITKGPSEPNAYRIVRKNGPDILLEVNDTGNSKDSKFVDGAIGSLFAIPTTEITFYYAGKYAASTANDYSFMDALYDFQRGNDGTKNDNGTVVGQFSMQDKNTVFPYGTITFPNKTVWTRI